MSKRFQDSIEQAIKQLKLFYNEDETIYFRSFKDKKDGEKGYIASGMGTLQDLIDNKLYDHQSKKKYDPKYLNRKNYGIFFCVNGGGFKDEDVPSIRSYFVDTDFGKEIFHYTTRETLEADKAKFEQKNIYKEFIIKKPSKKDGVWILTAVFSDDEINNRKENFLNKYRYYLKNTNIFETHSGFHIYFPLRKEESKDTFSLIQRGLADYFDGDVAVNNPARILRLSGFYHNKYNVPFQVKSVQLSDYKWTKDEIFQKFHFDLDRLNSKYLKTQVKGTLIREHVHIEEFTKRIIKRSYKEIKNETGIEWLPKAKIAEEMSYSAFIEDVKTKPFEDFIEYFPSLEAKFECHFHNDQNPSANVYESREGEMVYHCFGCGVLGNIIKIYQLDRNVSYKTAIEDLAAILGIRIKEPKWMLDQYQKIRANRDFLLSIVDENFKDYVPGMDALRKYMNANRRKVLSLLLDWNERKILEEEFMVDGESIFFISTREINRQVSDNGKTSSLVTTYRVLKLLILLGFVDVVPFDKVPKKLQMKAEKEQKKMNEIVSSRLSKMYNKEIHIQTNKIAFYKFNWFEDIYERAIEIAQIMKESKFSIVRNLNKNDINLIFGKETAERCYPSQKTSSKHQNDYEKFEKIVMDEIEEFGFFITENIREFRYKIAVSSRYLKKKEKEDILKRFLPTILNENNLTKSRVGVRKAQELFGYNGKSKSITVIKREKEV